MEIKLGDKFYLLNDGRIECYIYYGLDLLKLHKDYPHIVYMTTPYSIFIHMDEIKIKYSFKTLKEAKIKQLEYYEGLINNLKNEIENG